MVVLLPAQIVPLAAAAVMLGRALTVTIEVADDVVAHPLMVPVTVYVVVTVGDAVTALPVEALSPVAGVHV